MRRRVLTAMNCLVVTFILYLSVSNTSAKRRNVIDFTSPITLKKLFTLEVDLNILAERIYNVERFGKERDEDHLTYLNNTVNSVREIHAKVDSIEDYLAHPINVYHLTKRLRTNWKRLVKNFQNNPHCIGTQSAHLGKLAKTLPPEEFLINAAYDIAKVINSYNLPLQQILNGTIADDPVTEPISFDDAYDIAQISYDRDDFYTAIKWFNATLHRLRSNYTQTNVIGQEETKIITQLATANYKFGRPREALRLTNQLLAYDANNKRAYANKKFYEQIIQANDKDEDIVFKWAPPESKHCTKKRELCSQINIDKNFVHLTKQSNLKCYTVPAWKRYPLANSKIEILHRRPLILVIHDASNDNFTADLLTTSKLVLLKKAYADLGAYPEERLPFPAINILTKSRAAKTPTLTTTQRIISPFRTSYVEMRNFGMVGTCETPPKDLSKLTEGGRVATVALAVNNNPYGGNLVFPRQGVVAPVVKNSIIFWYATSTEPAVCPSLRSTVWYMWQSIYEKQGAMCRKSDKQFLPRRYKYL